MTEVKIESGVLVKLLPGSYLRVDKTTYVSGDTFRLPEERAQKLAHPADGSRPLVRILEGGGI